MSLLWKAQTWQRDFGKIFIWGKCWGLFALTCLGNKQKIKRFIKLVIKIKLSERTSRMRTTGFTCVATMQVTRATVDSCFVLVRTHQHCRAFLLQAESFKASSENFFRAALYCKLCGSLVGGVPNIPRAMRAMRAHPNQARTCFVVELGLKGVLWTRPCSSRCPWLLLLLAL